MRFLKFVFKIFIISTVLTAFVMGGIALYMKYYGKNILEEVLGKVIGSKIAFDGVTVNLDKYMASFKGFSMPNKIGFGKENVFKAEEFSVSFNKEKLKREGKAVLERVIVKKGTINIERNRNGLINIVSDSGRMTHNERGLAYTQEPAGAGGALNAYSLMRTLKGISVKDFTINFKDSYLIRQPYQTTLTDFNVDIVSKERQGHAGTGKPYYLLVTFKTPGRFKRGDFTLEGDVSISQDTIDMDTKIRTVNTDIMEFLLYFNRHTPFSLKEGIFSSDSALTIKENEINSLTTMVFHKLVLMVDPGKENAVFLEASVNRLVPYLTSSTGEIIFDFVIKGPAYKPKLGLGPRVKYAVGLVAMDEMNRLIQQLRNLSK